MQSFLSIFQVLFNEQPKIGKKTRKPRKSAMFGNLHDGHDGRDGHPEPSLISALSLTFGLLGYLGLIFGQERVENGNFQK